MTKRARVVWIETTLPDPRLGRVKKISAHDLVIADDGEVMGGVWMASLIDPGTIGGRPEPVNPGSPKIGEHLIHRFFRDLSLDAICVADLSTFKWFLHPRIDAPWVCIRTCAARLRIDVHGAPPKMMRRLLAERSLDSLIDMGGG